jgi:endonuclease/exonuclease/phosphatase family metal-dependent hydrolase
VIAEAAPVLEATSGRILRVATFNLENLGAGIAPETTPAERGRVLRPQLLRLRADVLCLQEVDSQRRADDGGRDFAALDALITDTPYAAFGRAATSSRSQGGPRGRHNLVVLSRPPLLEWRQVFHDLVSPPAYLPIAGDAESDGRRPIEWDRPLLYARLDVGMPRPLHVVNVHLRAPRAAWVPGGKEDGRVWRTMSGWAEGFFLAAVKRAGQALEARLLVDTLFDVDPEALILVCGDFNADLHQVPVRTIRGDEEDAGNAHLAFRTLVPVERSLARSRRFSVVHHGRPQMLDHVLVSRALLAWYRGVEVHNEALGDELMTPQAVAGAPESFHAPVVAEFRLPGA